MQNVYAFQATFVPRSGQLRADREACYLALVGAAKVWAAEAKLESPDGGGTAAVSDRTLDADRRLFTLTAAYPLAPGDPWRYVCETAVALTPIGLQGHAIVRVRRARDDGSPARFEPFRPAVVDRFLGLAHALAIGGEPIPGDAEQYDAAGVPRFVDQLLLNPARQLPLVVLTPTESGRPLVDPDRVMDELLGLAHVVELASRQATFALTDRVGKFWSCFNGAVRVYWPKITLDESYRQHPIFFSDDYPPGADTDDRLPLDVLRKVAAAALRRTVEAPLVTQLCGLADRQAHAQTEARLAELARGVAEGREFMQALDQAWSENRALAEEMGKLQAELTELRESHADMDEQWATVSANIARAEAAAQAERRAAERYRGKYLAGLKRVREAVALAQEEFAGTLIFLPSALKSAEDSPYQDPAKVFALFTALDGVAHARGGLGEDLHAVLLRAGFEYKPHISTTSEGKHGDEYRFRHDGERKLFENHVTLGGSHNPQECLSVHWRRDAGADRFVIAWCGKHLTNTRT